MAIRSRAAERRAGRAQRRVRRGPAALAPDRELPAGRLAPLTPLAPARREDQGAKRVAIALLATLLFHGAPFLLLLQRATARPEAPLEVTLVARPSPPVLPGAATEPGPLPPFREALRARSLPRLGRLTTLPTGAELARAKVRPAMRPLVADALSPRPALLRSPPPLRAAPLRAPAAAVQEQAKPELVRPEARKPEAGTAPVKPEPANPEAKQPEAKQPEPLKPEPLKPEPHEPDAVKPEPVKPEPPKPEPVKPEPPPEAKQPAPPPPAPPVQRPEPRFVIRDPDDPFSPPRPLVATAPAATPASDPTRQLVDAIAAAAHETRKVTAAPEARQPDGIEIDPLLAALPPDFEALPGSSELAGARSGDASGLGTSPEPGGALPGPAGAAGDGASGRSSTGGLVATDPGGVPVRTPVATRSGDPGAAAGNGGLASPAGGGGAASGSPGPLARKGVADGAPDGARTEGRPGSGRAFEGDFEELDETEEVHVRAWVRQLKRAVQGQWNTPKQVDRSDRLGKTLRVEFIIRRDGKLLLVRVSDGSGVPALDEAVLQAFRRAIIREFPEELPGKSKNWWATFTYND